LRKRGVIEVPPVVGPTLSVAQQGLDDIGQHHSFGQEALRISSSVVEGLFSSATAIGAANTVITVGGGPENVGADIVGVISFFTFYVQSEKSFKRANDEFLFPLIDQHIR
jgi:hypothetical protein